MMECPNCHFDNPDNTKFCGNCATPLSISQETLEAPTETMEATLFVLKTGSVISDRYEIIEEIGKGGMGKVYKVLDREINEKIALKLIRPEIASNKKIIERFRNEMKMARKISHKNVCRMFDIGKDGEKRYITMEFVSGEDLKKSIRRMGPLTIKKALSIAKQLCHGLSEAHQLGIVHRDLKPHNIMIDREGNTKIMDFGIALSKEAKGITDSGAIVGTPYYLSPEQVSGGKIDHRSDIYSLGVIMFEMVTGRVPFDGETTLSIAVKHKTDPPPNPKLLNPQIPEDLNKLILKCLEKDAKNRFESVIDVCKGLEKIQGKIQTTETFRPQKKMSSVSHIAMKFMARKYMVPTLLIASVCVIVILVLNILLKKTPASLDTFKPSLAIVYFENDTGEEEFDHWRKALSTLLIDHLAQSKLLKTVSEDTIFYILRKLNLLDASTYSTEDLKQIASVAGISHILGGSYTKAGDNFRIIALMYDGRSGALIARERVDGTGEKSMFSMAAELSKRIMPFFNFTTEQIANDLGKDVEEIAASDPVSYRYYQLGRYYQKRYLADRKHEDFNTAVDMFEKAIKINPDYASAFWGLGDIYENYFNNVGDDKYFDLMLSNYEKSYEIDPNLAGANAGLGWYYFYKGDNTKAYDYYKNAYKLNPNSAGINLNIGSFYLSIGLHHQAIKYYSHAINIDYFNIRAHQLRIRCYSRLGSYEKAKSLTEELITIEPDNLRFKLLHSRQLVMLEKYDEAEKIINTVEAVDPDSLDIKLTRALLSAKMGKKSEALALIDGVNPYWGTYLLSTVYSLLDMKKEAIDIVELGIKNGFEQIKSYLYPYPVLMGNTFYAELQNEPRFQDILEKQKKDYEENLLKFGEF